ncbi:uncharacterized protein APUU_40297S [Aspergillus puulaauensis]|uniref:Uncharacterized protein n=1 Tax=Aspergillus puulaauensis TaxID=1220207 RepID=A0A7R7XN06_9EURO|nr:uncharacterized protein APUU_40297S [Aspergillus puulaauensis]BCS23853.1 hypothetical protein APUU_40297S [Aspergillus puulaauensis]
MTSDLEPTITKCWLRIPTQEPVCDSGTPGGNSLGRMSNDHVPPIHVHPDICRPHVPENNPPPPKLFPLIPITVFPSCTSLESFPFKGPSVQLLAPDYLLSQAPRS